MILRPRSLIVLILALCTAALALFVLESARKDVGITQYDVGPTPVTRYARADADGPDVIIAHGFAGSRQMMQAYGLTLARAGYVVHAFDFEGHGRHPLPMSGDVTVIDGTTRLLMAQTQAVIAALPESPQPVALLGHSMATDILVRAAAETPGTGPLVLLSAFSEAITDDSPDNLLLITGMWEPGLREFALKAAETDAVTRQTTIAPYADHVSILHSVVGQRAALDWLDARYDRTSDTAIPHTGWALLALLTAIVALSAPLSRLLPAQTVPANPLPAGRFAIITLLPAALAPLIAVPLDPGLLPVLVADYLALHLAIYGALQLALLRFWKTPLGPVKPLAIAALLIWGLGAFGLALDRYGANFIPTPERLWIIAALCLGAIPFMLADALLTYGAPFWQRMSARLAFLISLAAAVALDFEGLFFLTMIAPVILLFYLVFGLMGRFAAHRAGPASAGLALGLILAWALGVSFPMFAAVTS